MCTIVREGESVSVSEERERITEHKRVQQIRAQHSTQSTAEHAAEQGTQQSTTEHATEQGTQSTQHAAEESTEKQSRAEQSNNKPQHSSNDGIQEARTLRVQVGLYPNCTDDCFIDD